MQWHNGDTFTAYGRRHMIESVTPQGVYTRRLNPMKGEPPDGERGFFSWSDLETYACKD